MHNSSLQKNMRTIVMMRQILHLKYDTPLICESVSSAVSSPAWLKELKSKKRLSQYDNEA